jgi:uncharacterized ferritin-like protein (DUF455 family)
MNSINQQLLNIIKSEELDEKLTSLVGEYSRDFNYPQTDFTKPQRDKRIQFSNEQIKFPKKHELKLKEKLAVALHAFANHELLAIEMMATAIIKFPTTNELEHKYKVGLIKAINDEQKHFKLYVNRLEELGFSFGDFPLNDFFWSKMALIKNLEEFAAVMNLTFESANLDFASFYENIFREYDDVKSANIMKVVYDDEISHVALGVNYLNHFSDKNLWDYYLKVLPFPLTPARAKGNVFNFNARKSAKLDDQFIETLKNYKDDFKITNRKEW